MPSVETIGVGSGGSGGGDMRGVSRGAEHAVSNTSSLPTAGASFEGRA